MEKHSISGELLVRCIRNEKMLTVNGETFYQWGQSGKMYKKREDAEKQGYAIEQQGYKTKKKK
jgi:hypothetical protein